MKVIKEGKKKNSTMRVTCKKCEAVLEIEAIDLRKVPEGRGLAITYVYTCPCCNEEQYLLPKQLSKEILFEMTN